MGFMAEKVAGQLGGTNSLRQRAIDETKRNGDGQKATALAILYLAEVIRDAR